MDSPGRYWFGVGVDSGERVATATWIAESGFTELVCDLPDTWPTAFLRLSNDLTVRQFGERLERIVWVGDYDANTGYVTVKAGVTVYGRRSDGLGTSLAAFLDSDEETIARYLADVVQDQIARAHLAWPWGDRGGFLEPELADGVAIWRDVRTQRTVARIGELTDPEVQMTGL